MDDPEVALALSTDAGYDDLGDDMDARCAELRRRMDLRKRTTPLCYVAILPRLIEVARQLGYALCVHGSLVRDLDLVAVPWVDAAEGADALVAALAKVCGGIIFDHQPPTNKPHGRKAWLIHTGAEMYIDLSVMPRSERTE